VASVEAAGVAGGVAVAGAAEEEGAEASADSAVVVVSEAVVAGRAGDEQDLES
jgi:hypothetical protein